MANPDPNQIRSVLREEIPELKSAGGISGVIGAVFMLLASVGLSAVVGASFFWLIAEVILEADYEDSSLRLAMIVTPVLGFIVGYLTRDNLALPGGKNRSMDDYGDELMGCVLYLLHMLGSSVYHSVVWLSQSLGKDRTQELELAVSIVSYLLRQGEVPTARLAESLVDQGVPRDRVRDTLVLMRQQRVIEPGDETTRLSPSLKPRFL